jgi:hypothetical protein
VPSDDTNRGFIRDFVSKRVSDIFVMANLSRVGSIQVSDSLLVQDGRLKEYSKLPAMDAEPLYYAVDLATEINWPKLQKISFKKVWTWANQNLEFLEGFTHSSTGRALSAFSRFFVQAKDDWAMQLLWSLIGIEALYVRGKVSVMEQVREKIQVLLGKPTSRKKIISEMYDFRSRFMHGDLDFPGLYHVWDASPDYEKYTSNQLEAVAIAIAILTATLQEIIVRGWTSLDFSYAVNAGPDVDLDARRST